MRKRLIVPILFVFALFIILSTVSAASKDFENMTESQRVDLAYKCLDSKVENMTCDKLTTPEKIYATLSTSQCTQELVDEAKNDECWPKSRCDVKTTAQAVLALDKARKDTDKPVDWLLEQKEVPTDLIWFLETETRNASTCEISYSDRAYGFNIAENKKLSASNLGGCVKISSSGYWLEIEPSCYDLEYDVSCDKSFLTTLLFKNPNEETIHVLDKIHSAPEEGTTVEKINSFCFSGAAGCDYEGTLWATMVLDKLGEDITPFVPYLISGEKENREYFPSPFLYYITGFSDYAQDIIDRQINEQYWMVSNGKYLDTAIALLPFQTEDLDQKTNTIEWLLDIQQENGCWDGENIVSNGALLYSIWPRGYLGSNGGSGSGTVNEDDGNSTSNDNDCELSGNYCLNSGKCTGNILPEYSSSCTGVTVCCDAPVSVTSCEADFNGEICQANEYCPSTGTEKLSDDLTGSQTCCVGAPCKVKESTPDENTCEQNLGLCEDFSCGTGYQETNSYTCSGGQICCTKSVDTTHKSKWWIWVLFILIVLVVIAIIYRDKIKELIEKMQNKGKGPSSSAGHSPFSGRPGFPPRPGFSPPRKIIPPSRPMPSRPMNSPRPMNPAMRPKPKSPRELDDVLKKLKDMSS